MLEFDGSSSELPHAARRADARVVELGDRARAARRVHGAVVDEAPRRAAVRRLVEAPAGDPRDRPRHARAAGRAHAAKGGRRRDVDRVRLAGHDHDLADALALELGLADRAAPVLAAVGRLVDAGAGNAAGGADVRLAGADVDGVARRVVRVDGHGAGRVDAERPAQVRPVRLALEDVVRVPDAAARRRDVRRALVRRALRRQCDRGRPTAGDVRVGHVQAGRAQLFERIEGLARADAHPLALLPLSAVKLPALRLVERSPCGVHLRDRDRVLRIRALHERLFGRGRRALVLHVVRPGRGKCLQVPRQCRRLLAADDPGRRSAVASTRRCGDQRRHGCEDHDEQPDQRRTSTSCSCHRSSP